MEVCGKVIQGGKTASRVYGIPTANLDARPTDLAPGVYIGLVKWENVAWSPCVISWHDVLEVHVLDWTGNLYDQELTVAVDKRVSDFLPFESHGQMKEKIHADLLKAKLMLGIN